MDWRKPTLWFVNGLAAALAIFILADAFGLQLLPTINQSLLAKDYGLLYVDKEKSFPGYTLVAPLRGNTVWLVDWHGKVFKSWRIPGLPDIEALQQKPERIVEGILQAKLLPNGHILVGHGLPNPGESQGSMGILTELDWNGNVVWNYENANMHHDFTRLPDSRTAVIVSERLPDNLAMLVNSQGNKNASPSAKKNVPPVFSDAILELDAKGNTVWRWAIWEHLDPKKKENFTAEGWSKYQWTAMNSIEYVADNPITHKPAYLISAHRLASLFLIERESGKIIWRGGGRELIHSPHSATMTKDGNILIFDNGADPPPNLPKGIVYINQSFISEIKPAVYDGGNFSSQISYSFNEGRALSVVSAFFTPINGSVQELGNGNILVSAGLTGRIFEIARTTQTVVWDFISPFGLAYSNWPSNFMNNGVYSAHRYPAGYAPHLK